MALDGTLQNTFRQLHTKTVTAVALPDNQHALSCSTTRPSSSSTSTTAPVRTFTHQTLAVTSLALLPDGLRFVAGPAGVSYSTAQIAYHGLAPM